ncbi:MAG: RluA family pseudouridine synthase, partial [Pseudomonadota bacterium]
DLQRKIRIDKYLSNNLPDISRTQLQNLIAKSMLSDENGVIYNDASEKVIENHIYILKIPPPIPTDIVANPAIKFTIIHEDDDLLVINKPANLTVHPGAGNYQDTLVNGLLHYLKDNLSGIGGVERPGIVHRLDKNTSGLMIVAKNDYAHLFLSKQLASRELNRRYYAFCWNEFQQLNGMIHTHIDRNQKNRKLMSVYTDKGREAITNYQVVKTFCQKQISLIECKLATGRTHQIRVHMKHIGHPILGDQEYGKKITNINVKYVPDILLAKIDNISRQLLHAHKIGFIHPKTKEAMDFSVELPDDMQEILDIATIAI